MDNLLLEAYKKFKENKLEEALILYNNYIELYPEISSSIYVITNIIKKHIYNNDLKINKFNYIDEKTTIIKISYLEKLYKEILNKKSLI